MVDSSQSVTSYLKDMPKQLDGVVLIACSFLSILFAILLSLDLMPGMHDENGTQIPLFLITPFIQFMFRLKLELTSYSDGRFSSLYRSCFITGIFLFNFKITRAAFIFFFDLIKIFFDLIFVKLFEAIDLIILYFAFL